MKKSLFMMILFVTAFLSSKAIKAEIEKREVPSFSEISLRISGTLYFTQGPKQSVEIEAKASILKEIITEVKDHRLNIRHTAQNFFRNSIDQGTIIIRITVPEIESLNVSGSSDIVAEEKIETRNLELKISGSGNVKINNLSAERVITGISGSGNLTINEGGPADELSVAISGSGNVKASGFEAKTVEVRMSGSGNCSVMSNGTVSARISGSGKVYYSGNPSVESSVSGSGAIRKAK